MGEPITRSDAYLAALGGEAVLPPEPITRMEMYLAYLNGLTDTYPDPITRTEQYLFNICQNGGIGSGGSGVTIRNQPKTITENGTYKHDSGYTGLGPVTVAVPQQDPMVQPLEVTENGTYSPPAGVDGYSPVTVNVAGSGGGDDTLQKLLADNLEEYSNESVTALNNYSFYRRNNLKRLNLPNVTTGGFFMCAENTALVEVNMPKLTASYNQMFDGCTALETVNFPNIKSGYVNHAFRNCTSLKHAYFDGLEGGLGNSFLANAVNLEEISFPSWSNKGNVGISAFTGCSALKKIDFAGTVNLTGAGAFYNCTALKALIIRGSTVGNFSVATALDGSSIAAGTGYIYVPSALLDTYKTATNWSVYADQFRAIEGSEYE